MRLREGDSLQEALNKIKHPKSELIVQFKYDGFKVLATKQKNKVKLYSRRGVDITARAPSIVKELQRLLRNGDAVLGEMVYHIKNRQSLQKLQSILHSKKQSDAIRKTKEHKGKLVFHVYDILSAKGKNISKVPLQGRLEELNTLFPASGNVKIVQSFPFKEYKKAIKRSLKCGGEGLVIKPLLSIYKYRKFGENEPFGDWWKYKPKGKTSNTTDVILINYVKKKEKYVFDAYQVKNGQHILVGKLSGLDKATEKEVVSLLKKGEEVVAEVSYQTRLSSGKFRHMGWVRLRLDKPVKSATFHTNPGRMMSMQPQYMAYLITEEPSRVVVQEFSSEEFVTPFQQAYMQALQKEGEGEKGKLRILDEKQFKNIKKKKVKSKGVRKKNPRRSLVKEALKKEALRFVSFEDFARRYWNACARGIYWYPTNESKFYIGKSEEKTSAQKKFAVFCNPGLALRGIHEKSKYVAELDVGNLSPSDLKLRKGADGSEILIVSNIDKVNVLRVVEAEQAFRSFRYQQSLLPSSKDQLMLFWADTWRSYEEKKKLEQEKLLRAREREARRVEKLDIAREEAEKKFKRRKERESKNKKTSKKKTAKKKAKRKNPSTPSIRQVNSLYNNPEF